MLSWVGRTPRLRAVAVAVALGVTGAGWLSVGATTAGAAGPPAPGTVALGVNADKVFGLPSYRWGPFLTEMAIDHTQVVRYTAFWQSVEPNAPGPNGHTYSWSFYDQVVTALAQHHLRWIPVIAYSTRWSASYYTTTKTLLGTTRTPDLYSPPIAADVPDYAAFAAALVARYGQGGSFWVTNPLLTPQPVTEIQVWNEPNIAYFWQPAANASAYAGLYQATRDAVRAVAPNVEVAVGALGNPAGAFIDSMFVAAPSVRPDAVADTPYDHSASYTIQDVAGLRSALDANGALTTPIEVAEFGWPLRGTASWTTTMTDVQRAAALQQVMDSLGKGDCGVDVITPYTWWTSQSNTKNVYDWFGLVSATGTETNSSAAYAREIALLDGLMPFAHATTSPCARPFTVTAARASSPAAGTTCIRSVATSGGNGGVAGATITATATAGTSRWTGQTVSGGDGSGTICLAIPTGTAVAVTVTAEHPYFEPVPTAQLATVAS